MSVRRRAAKRDANERAIINALASIGATVVQVSETGFPDLVVGYSGITWLMEVKAPGKGLTADQQDFHKVWRGSHIHMVESVEQAFRAIGLETVEHRPWTNEERAELLPAPRRKR
jgi:hypothetical protein